MLLLLLACAPQNATNTPSGVWLSTVSARIAAEAVAIREDEGGFSVSLYGADAVARFDADGARLGEGLPVYVSLSEWGFDGALRPAHPVEPAFGECGPGVGVGGDCLRRLEHDHGGVVTWWLGLQGGVELGWTVAEAPAGAATLSLVVQHDGAERVEAVGEGAAITAADGRLWTVSEPVAWDADGAALLATARVDGDALVIEVDVRGAAFPVTVDPVYSTADTTFLGTTLGEELGSAVAAAGDVNGDGYDDVIIGAAGIDRAYVFHGSYAGLGTTAATTLRGSGTTRFGDTVAGIGDVNGDGYDDVMVGDPYYSSSGGRIDAYHGSASGVSSTAAYATSLTVASAALGQAIDGAGDLNGDGYDDVIVGAPGYTGTYVNGGLVLVLYGASTGLSTSSGTTLTGTQNLAGLGTAVAGLGDVNSDGYDDVAISEPWYDTVNILLGSSTGLTLTGATTVSVNNYYYFGTSVDGAGDVNGDGALDLIVGEPAYSSTRTAELGRAYIFHNSGSGTFSSPARTLTGSFESDQLGWDVAGVGDVDNDGYDDVLVGVYGYGYGTYVGGAQLFLGSASGIPSSYSQIFIGGASYEYYGSSLDGAGDVDGDGWADIIIGAYRYTGSKSAVGKAEVYRGYSDVDGDGVVGADDCDDKDAKVGVGTTRYVDDDDDGFGGEGTIIVCDGDTGWSANNDDCDDTSASTNPGAQEVCDLADVDEDCDGVSDDADGSASSSTFTVYFPDADGDGYGDINKGSPRCDLPSGYVTNAEDCDDSREDVNPEGSEYCNGRDDDCNGEADDGIDCDTGETDADTDSDSDSDTDSATRLRQRLGQRLRQQRR
ncbi:MAG: VCBS repeat-containing protein [Deltaproteobacteria bacterium]|nr:VCBS repeat-containing protein [Deltaproteobacteria bacterium]